MLQPMSPCVFQEREPEALRSFVTRLIKCIYAPTPILPLESLAPPVGSRILSGRFEEWAVSSHGVERPA
jgi:hypothetical protein